MKLNISKKNIITVAFLALLSVASLFFVLRQWDVLSSEKKTVSPANLTKETKQFPGSLQLVVLSKPVYMQSSNSNSEVEIIESVELKKGTIVRTGSTGRAELRYPNKSVTRLDFNSKVDVKDITVNPQVSLLSLLQGSIWNRVAKLAGKDSFKTETGSMVATVRGTAYRMGILPDGTNITMVVEGNVNVKMDNKPEYEMDKNKSISFNPEQNKEPIVVDFNPATEGDEWTTFNIEQDEQWMELNKDIFKDDVLGVDTNNPEVTVARANTIQTPNLITCTGPDGVAFKATATDCENLNTFWKKENPPKDTSTSNLLAQAGSNTTLAPSPTSVRAPTGQTAQAQPSSMPPTATPIQISITPTAIFQPVVPTATYVPPTPTLIPSFTPVIPQDGGNGADSGGGPPDTDYRVHVVCVELHENNTYTAFFDYELYRSTPKFLFISRIEGGEGQPPATLTPNNARNYVSAVGQKSNSITWVADNVSATATPDNLKCENNR